MVSLLFTAQKVSVFGVILVHIFPTFSCIRTEYREILRILRISLYSVQMREIAGKMQTRVTLNTGTFYAVVIINDFFQFGRNSVYELSSGNYFQRSNIQTINFANKSVKYQEQNYGTSSSGDKSIRISYDFQKEDKESDSQKLPLLSMQNLYWPSWFHKLRFMCTVTIHKHVKHRSFLYNWFICIYCNNVKMESQDTRVV